MRVLITGINGFIGQHLAWVLTEKGYQITGLGRDNGGVLNKTIVERAIQNVDIVVHLAALTSHKDIVDNRFETLETNFLGTKNVLDAFLKSKTAKKFLYASTGKVYGKIIRLPIDEEHPTNPLNILGKSKLITEKLIDFYASTSLSASSKEFIIFRIFNVYGLGQRENFLIPTILSQVSSGKKEITLGDIKAKRDHVYIDDVIDAFVSAIEKKGSKGLSIYNICTEKSSSAKDIVGIIEKIKGGKIKVKVNKNLLRQDEMDEEFGSYKKAKRQLRWEPKIILKDGLRRLLPPQRQVIILAGGKGTRMQKKYPRVPKLLVPFTGKPFIDHLIEYLKKNGFDDIIICAGYLGDKVKKYVEQKDYGVKIRIPIEKEPLGTGGALNSIEDLIDKDFFLLFGDVYTSVNLKKMLVFHRKKKAMITAVIHESKHPQDSDLVQFNSDMRITKILKKPHTRISENPYNLAAMYLVSRDIKKYLLPKVPYDFERDLLTKLIFENIPIYGYNTEELIMDFGTPERLKKLEKELQK